jgi:hypothetical protein
MPSGKTSLSENDEDGTTQRFSSSSQRRQCGDATLRIFVTLGSRFFPLRPSNGGRMPQRHEQLAPSAHSDDRRKMVREGAGPGVAYCRVAAQRLREVADRLNALTLSEQVELETTALASRNASHGAARRRSRNA